MIVPIAFDAQAKATTRVRSDSLRCEVVEVERRVGAQLDVLDDEVAVVGELEPGRDAAVVVERGDEDLVAGRRTPARRCARA